MVFFEFGGTRFRHSRSMRNPQVYVSGKRSMWYGRLLLCTRTWKCAIIATKIYGLNLLYSKLHFAYNLRFKPSLYSDEITALHLKTMQLFYSTSTANCSISHNSCKISISKWPVCILFQRLHDFVFDTYSNVTFVCVTLMVPNYSLLIS